jgi:hypothetical protein
MMALLYHDVREKEEKARASQSVSVFVVSLQRAAREERRMRSHPPLVVLWRCRESNPGPKKFNTNVYKRSHRHLSRPEPHPATESVQRQPMSGALAPVDALIGVCTSHFGFSVALPAPPEAENRRT